jgi:hypothetical protein
LSEQTLHAVSYSITPMSDADIHQATHVPIPYKANGMPTIGRCFLVDLMLSAGQVFQGARLNNVTAGAHHITDSILTALSMIANQNVHGHRLSMMVFNRPELPHLTLTYNLTLKRIIEIQDASCYDATDCRTLTGRFYYFEDGSELVDRHLDERQLNLLQAHRKTLYCVNGLTEKFGDGNNE